MRAGEPDVIEVGVEEVAPLQAGEALVRVEAAGLNHAETLIRSGTYAVRVPFPFALGGEGAGTVVAVGPEAKASEPERERVGQLTGSLASRLGNGACTYARFRLQMCLLVRRDGRGFGFYCRMHRVNYQLCDSFAMVGGVA
jgi:NADPH:quinone reductase-like Zn-dependent oxidoreductase